MEMHRVEEVEKGTEQQRRSSIKRHGRLMPLFIFIRNSDIEAEGGFLLAGKLIMDIPHKKMQKKQQMIAELIRNLTADRHRIGSNALVICWPGEAPSDADEVEHNDALMMAWIDKCQCIGVRVDPREYDGSLRLDSEQMQEMGLAVKGPATKQ